MTNSVTVVALSEELSAYCFFCHSSCLLTSLMLLTLHLIVERNRKKQACELIAAFSGGGATYLPRHFVKG